MNYVRPWCFLALLSHTLLKCLTLSSMLFTKRPNLSRRCSLTNTSWQPVSNSYTQYFNNTNNWYIKPNTHRRRDETVESRRVGGVYMNLQLVGDSFVVSSVWTHPSAVVTHTAALFVHIAESVGSRREFMYTPPTRRDLTVSSRRRRRCVLGLMANLAFYTFSFYHSMPRRVLYCRGKSSVHLYVSK